MTVEQETTGTAPSFSFPASARLRLKRDIDCVFRNGRRARGACMTLVALRPSPDGSFKASVSARKKEMHRAHDRNRARRRIRETLRLHRPALADDLWLMVQARPDAREAPWASLAAEFNSLCGQARLMRDTGAAP